MLTVTIITILTFGIAFFIEAKHDYYLWINEVLLAQDASNEFDKQEGTLRRRGWHRLDWFYLAIIAIGWSFAVLPLNYNQIPIVVLISMLKILIFNPRINLLKGEDWNHLSGEGFEGKFKDKPNIYFLGAFILFAICVAYLIIQPFNL